MSKILVINIGSTSTKVGLFVDQVPVFRETIGHSAEELAQLQGYDEWLRFHHNAVNDVLLRHTEMLEDLDLVVSRGGLTRPLEGGAYWTNEGMLRDLRSGDYGWHPCNVGPEIGSRLASKFGVDAMIYDSPVTDELSPLARYSGLKGVDRESAFHVLSQKSAARKAARDLNILYQEANFIVAHLGGGITIGAHLKGEVVDGTHGLGEGPFTPQRTGSLPVNKVVGLCFSGGFSKEELNRRLFSQGGIYSYLGTHDTGAIEERVARGDSEALLVLEAMAYQISKDIAAMAAVLRGEVDAVVLTGNVCKAKTVIEEIRNRISFLGAVCIYPGEDELENLALGGDSVLATDVKVKEYE